MSDKETFEKLSKLCSQANEEIKKLSIILFELKVLTLDYESGDPKEESVARAFNDVLTSLNNMTANLAITEVTVKKPTIPRCLYE
jgi:hypothetical protein